MRDVFIPFDAEGSRERTAILLVGTAREFGIHQRSIQTTGGGFWITQELSDVLYDERRVKASAKAAKKTSGNRAAKNKKE